MSIDQHQHHVRVGIFTIAAGALVALVLIVFGGMKFWKHHDAYDVDVDGSVIGLTKGAQVYLNGVQVGRVSDIGLSKENASHVRVELELDRGTPIHKDTQAFLTYAGITGLKVIDMKGGDPRSPVVPPGSHIPLGKGIIDKLQDQAEQVAAQSEQLLKRASQIMDSATHAMANLEAITDPAPLKSIVDSTRATAANLQAASGSLEVLVDESRGQLRTTLASVDATAKSANTLMDKKIAPMFDSANGLVLNVNGLFTDLRGVVHGNEGQVQSALGDLRQAARTFKDLAREIKERPSRLLFSSPQGDRKLP